MLCIFMVFLFFKQKTAYEMRISDWSSDVCSSDLFALVIAVEHGERDAIGPSPIAVPQRDDAGPRRRFEHQRGTIARNRARMAFEPEAVIGKAPPAETIARIAGGLTQGAAIGTRRAHAGMVGDLQDRFRQHLRALSHHGDRKSTRLNSSH